MIVWAGRQRLAPGCLVCGGAMECRGEPIGLRGDTLGDLPGEVEHPLPGDPSTESCGERGDTDRLPFQPPTPV